MATLSTSSESSEHPPLQMLRLLICREKFPRCSYPVPGPRNKGQRPRYWTLRDPSLEHCPNCRSESLFKFPVHIPPSHWSVIRRPIEHKLSNVRNEPSTQSIKNKKKVKPLETLPKMEDWGRYIGRMNMVKARAGEECPEHFGWDCYCVGFLSREERRLADVKPLLFIR